MSQSDQPPALKTQTSPAQKTQTSVKCAHKHPLVVISIMNQPDQLPAFLIGIKLGKLVYGLRSCYVEKHKFFIEKCGQQCPLVGSWIANLPKQLSAVSNVPDEVWDCESVKLDSSISDWN